MRSFYLLLVSLFLLITTNQLSYSQTTSAPVSDMEVSTLLSPEEFLKKISETKAAQIIDVRTAVEFDSGHIKGAQNANINWSGFRHYLGTLDTSKAVFIYAKTDAMSKIAAHMVHFMGGFKVYELAGGIDAWQLAKFPVVEDFTVKANKGLSLAAFNELVKKQKLILIDFSAVWCGPCVKLSPIIEEISKEEKAKLVVKKLDVDSNTELVPALNVYPIPSLFLYQKGKLVWRHQGLIAKDALLEIIHSYE